MTLDGRPAFPIDNAAIRERARGMIRSQQRPDTCQHPMTRQKKL